MKDATQVRRDEFEIEERCISAVEDLCKDLRVSIDQSWIREHLKERRIYEAASGRMDRLEKSALIIWNKHSHLAIGLKEEYESWLLDYKHDRDIKMQERRMKIDREWKNWRLRFVEGVKSLCHSIKPSDKLITYNVFHYDMSVPLEKNISDITSQCEEFGRNTLLMISNLRSKVNEYVTFEMNQTNEFGIERKNALINEWQENLFMLNSAINRRVGGLKDMEADLEETVRLTILQHEVENEVFEQLSCARLEQFWMDWRQRLMDLSKQLKETQEDYRIAKNIGNS